MPFSELFKIEKAIASGEKTHECSGCNEKFCAQEVYYCPVCGGYNVYRIKKII